MSIVLGVDFGTCGVRVFLACGVVASIPEAQDALCLAFIAYSPDRAEAEVYDGLYWLYRDLYFTFGQADTPRGRWDDVLRALRGTARKVNRTH